MPDDVGILPVWNPTKPVKEIYVTAHISSPPTQADLASALGDAGYAGDGTLATVDNMADHDVTVWCVAMGAKWWYLEMGAF
jgi:hypothetical protein